MRLVWDWKHLNRLVGISFPRGPSMKALYPEIRAWFKSHDLEWKDYTRDGQKYMMTFVDKNPKRLENLVRDAGKTIFGIVELELSFQAPFSPHFRIVISRYLNTFMGLMAIMMFSFIGLVCYEVFHLFTLSSPSFVNIDKIELWMVATFFGSIFLAYLIETKPNLKKPYNRKNRLYVSVQVVKFATLALMFFTV